MLSISGLLQLILAVWAAGYGSAVPAVRCADLVLPLRPKDDPTDKFDDSVVFVRQFMTFFGGSLACTRPLGPGGIFSQLAALFAAQREPGKSLSLMHKM